MPGLACAGRCPTLETAHPAPRRRCRRAAAGGLAARRGAGDVLWRASVGGCEKRRPLRRGAPRVAGVGDRRFRGRRGPVPGASRSVAATRANMLAAAPVFRVALNGWRHSAPRTEKAAAATPGRARSSGEATRCPGRRCPRAAPARRPPPTARRAPRRGGGTPPKRPRPWRRRALRCRKARNSDRPDRAGGRAAERGSRAARRAAAREGVPRRLRERQRGGRAARAAQGAKRIGAPILRASTSISGRAPRPRRANPPRRCCAPKQRRRTTRQSRKRSPRQKACPTRGSFDRARFRFAGPPQNSVLMEMRRCSAGRRDPGASLFGEAPPPKRA